MTSFHLHDDAAVPAGQGRPTLGRAFARLATAFRTIHESIVAAKTRRLQRELMFHADSDDEPLEEIVGGRPLSAEEFAKLPQRPMVFGDKWDF